MFKRVKKSEKRLPVRKDSGKDRLSVSSVNENHFNNRDEPGQPEEEFTAEAMEAMYQAQLAKHQKFHKRNLVIEGSCNYFFWMDKIAMVGTKFISVTSVILAQFDWLHCFCYQTLITKYGT